MDAYMSNKAKLFKDIKDFQLKGYRDKMLKLYRKFPKTECKECGLCCTDSPIITYPEFLFACDYLYDDNFFDNQTRITIYKNAIKQYMLGLIRTDVSCPFLDDNKRCLIYERAPLACKRWGIQSKEENNRDVSVDHYRNKQYKDFYASKGIDIPDDIINSKIPYCQNVKIVKNPYNFTSNDFDTVVLKSLMKMVLYYRKNNARDWSIGNYLLYSIFGKDLFEDRIKVIKEYQHGNKNSIEEYIERIDFTNFS